MDSNVIIEAYHGTDLSNAESILKSGFKCRPNKHHWLGNGIYFYMDFSLARWWTTNPTNKFGVRVRTPAIIRCKLNVNNEYILDLRRLKDYTKFVEIYRNEFLPFLFKGDLISVTEDMIDTKKLRCTYCDYLNIKYKYKLIIGTFYLPNQPYMPTEYGKFFHTFNISYIENQICVFDTNVISSMELVTEDRS
ncbi:poly(ADP-ribose) polymerase-like protein [Herbinix hemicellulosilytica]|uniref:PARP catalytic domain-containing protein n=1 Tax=Herbinix hemicellulosilytica TaxID=1564487 RepID=A0A0H5SVR5_HERHM|nr:hypothetical protein [Herbinix hemicellulosilytica]RBP60746.1 poly(ADP-ribose) polymerase-like protein [Herbinix hemicellulosilytica]CRZ34433.1 hypothetical protein HHT355_1231 [Herbinix hemicellulosilytica]HPU63941.1 hypothetical protein [Mobilitalea sp.]